MGRESHADVHTIRDGVHEFMDGGVSTCLARFRIGTVLRLLIVGAGPEAGPLLALAQVLGWRTVLVDHRPAAVKAVTTLADEAMVANPSEALGGVSSLNRCGIGSIFFNSLTTA